MTRPERTPVTLSDGRPEVRRPFYSGDRLFVCQEWPEHIARCRMAIRQRWDREGLASLSPGRGA